jgi:predicted RNA-binding protein with PIN domain
MVSYLVDGNNVMGQRVGWHKDRAGARRRLVDDLVRFAQSTGVPVEVVFDGAPDDTFPDGAPVKGVHVHFAARGSDADTRIKELVDRAPERDSINVVTSDRALADYVRRGGVRVIRSGEFRRQLDALDESGAARTGPGTQRHQAGPNH